MFLLGIINWSIDQLIVIGSSQDARKARGVEAAVAEAVVAVSDGDDGEGVRVEIEESDEETMEATPATAVEPSGEPLHSLERLNKKEPRATFTFTYSYDSYAYTDADTYTYFTYTYNHIYIYTYTYTHIKYTSIL